MKKTNIALLLCEVLLCINLCISDALAFGHGENDLLFVGGVVMAVIIHGGWTIWLLMKRRSFRAPVIIFSLLMLFVLLKISFLRGAEFPWDGDVVVNHGKMEPNKYVTTLWVSDPECTGCDDCVVDSGRIIIPDTLRKYVDTEAYGHALLLEGKNPYRIQGVAYRRYRLKGLVTGVRDGKPVFYVGEWVKTSK